MVYYNITIYTFDKNAIPNPNVHIAIPRKTSAFAKKKLIQVIPNYITETAENQSAVSVFSADR